MDDERNYDQVPRPIKRIADFDLPRQPVKKKGIHSELHEVVAMLRKDFEETAKMGKGSFGFYLKMLKPVPISLLRIWFASIKDSPKLDTPLARCKIFWWKFKQWKQGK